MKRHPRPDNVGNIAENVIVEIEQPVDEVNVAKKRSKIKSIKRYLVDYSANSTLHGLKYIGEKERTFVEKLFWLLMFICCVAVCASLIRKVWLKWSDTPVIVSFAEKSTPVWQIPYPAVTVCSETKAQQTKFNFTKYMNLYYSSDQNFTDEERNMFEDLSLVCNGNSLSGRETSLGNETVRNIKRVSPKLREVFAGCKWKGIYDSCSELLQPILTEEGLCYTFNIMGADELFRTENLNTDYNYLENVNRSQTWFLETGYLPNTPLETYPRRGTGNGAADGLTFLLRTKKIDLDYICRGPVQGFKILLHNPAELPRLSQQYFKIPLSQEMVVAIKPKIMTTSEGLRPYSAIRRQCYFSNDRYLKYFKVYTQANCEMECLTNFTYARCDCVNFGMPHGPEMQVCNAGKIYCMKKARRALSTMEIQSELLNITEKDTYDKARKVAAECKCLPACTSIDYEIETSQVDFDWKTIYRAFEISLNEEEEDLLYARVVLFFKEAQFITSRRSELYGLTDFLANCGGLLGLFMGFSFLSVAEILYFLTLRLYCLLWKRRQSKPCQSQNKKNGKLKDLHLF